MLETGGLSAGREAEEAQALWPAMERDSTRRRSAFDSTWFARLLASAGEDGTVRLWGASRGQPVATLHGHIGAVRGGALPADGQVASATTSAWTSRA